jgi:hypothetical protein
MAMLLAILDCHAVVRSWGRHVSGAASFLLDTPRESVGSMWTRLKNVTECTVIYCPDECRSEVIGLL